MRISRRLMNHWITRNYWTIESMKCFGMIYTPTVRSGLSILRFRYLLIFTNMFSNMIYVESGMSTRLISLENTLKSRWWIIARLGCILLFFHRPRKMSSSGNRLVKLMIQNSCCLCTRSMNSWKKYKSFHLLSKIITSKKGYLTNLVSLIEMIRWRSEAIMEKDLSFRKMKKDNR